MKNKAYSPFALILGLIIFAGLFIGSVSTKGGQEEKLAIPRFDYEPPGEPGKKVDITFSLVNPNYAEPLPNTEDLRDVSPFTDFSRYMGEDFEEMMIHRGFSIRGPFETTDDMLYGDKEGSDFIFSIEIDLQMQSTTFQKHLGKSYTGEQYVYFDGDLTLSGKIHMEALEPISKEKVWKKSIPYPETNISIIKTKRWKLPIYLKTIVLKDPGFRNPLVDALEQSYKKALHTAYRYLEPQEFDAPRALAKRIRKKVSIGNK